jgi:hypothetical protein
MLDNPNQTDNNYTTPSPERNTRDLVALALGHLPLTRCPGGRYTHKGYTCSHCGIDYTLDENEGFCGQPIGDDGYTPFDAAVARRKMLKSEETYNGDASST